MARPGPVERQRRHKNKAKAKVKEESRQATRIADSPGISATDLSVTEVPAAEVPGAETSVVGIPAPLPGATQEPTKAPSLPTVTNTKETSSSNTFQGTAAASPLRAVQHFAEVPSLRIAQNTAASPSLSIIPAIAATSPLVTVQSAAEIPSLSTSQTASRDFTQGTSPKTALKALQTPLPLRSFPATHSRQSSVAAPFRRSLNDSLGIMDPKRPGGPDGAVPIGPGTGPAAAIAPLPIPSDNSDISQDTFVESVRSKRSSRPETRLYEPAFRPVADKMGSSALLVKYTRDPDPDLKLHTFWLRLPPHNVDFTEPGVAHAMNLISMNCKAWISTSKVPTLSQIQIRVEDKNDFRQVKARITAYLCRDNQEEAPSWHPFTLVQHPADGKGYEAQIVQIDVGQGRLVLKKLDIPLVGDVDELLPSLVEEFQEVFTKVAREMKSEMWDMRMRVHIGKVEMKRWKRQDAMTYDEYEDLVRKAGKLGFSDLDQKIGDIELGRMIRNKIYASTDKFSPPISTISSLEDIVPRHYAVFFVEGGKRIEIEFEKVGQSAKAGQMKAYSAPQHEITAMCPGHYYDWKLDVQCETSVKNLRPGLASLRQKVKFGPSTSNDQFPTPILPFEDIRNAGIGNIAGKSVWTFECMSSKYYLEFCIYREWTYQVATVKTVDQEPKVTCGVTFYGAGWDDEMRAQNTVITPRNFGKDHKKLLETGYESFIVDVGKIKHFVEEARAFYDHSKGIEPMPLPLRPSEEEVQGAKIREAARREETERVEQAKCREEAERLEIEQATAKGQESTKVRNAEFSAMTQDEKDRYLQTLRDRAIRRKRIEAYLGVYEKNNGVKLDRAKVLERVDQAEVDETEVELEEILLQHVVKQKQKAKSTMTLTPPSSIEDLLGGPTMDGEVLQPTQVLKPAQAVLERPVSGKFHQQILEGHSAILAAMFDTTPEAVTLEPSKPMPIKREIESKKAETVETATEKTDLEETETEETEETEAQEKKPEDHKSDDDSSVNLIDL